jgi:hypothetical protein
VQHPILVADTDDKIKSYTVETLPTVVIVGPDGRVSHYWVADRGVQDAIRETNRDAATLRRIVQGLFQQPAGALRTSD